MDLFPRDPQENSEFQSSMASSTDWPTHSVEPGNTTGFAGRNAVSSWTHSGVGCRRGSASYWALRAPWSDTRETLDALMGPELVNQRGPDAEPIRNRAIVHDHIML